jgi:toxin ParE1/3/4
MAVEVTWQPQSLEDISNIAEFISKESAYYAAIQTEKFFAKASILETFPQAGRIVPEFGVDALRELIIGPYRLIYYIVSDSRIDVLTIHHSAMLLSNSPLFKEEQ